MVKRLLLVFVFTYLGIVMLSKLRLIYKQHRFQETINQLDKNKNGQLEDSERTVDYQKAYLKATGNTGITFAPITAIPYAALITLLVYFFVLRKRRIPIKE